MIYPGAIWSVGMLSTYAERPYLNRTALVNALDYDVRPGESWRWYGHIIGSMVDSDDDDSNGYGLFNKVEYAPNDRWTWKADLTQYSSDLDFNDMGYMERNSLEKLFFGFEHTRAEFSGNPDIASVTWEGKVKLERNTDNVRLPGYLNLEWEQNRKSGTELAAEIGYSMKGYDDLISRGNGLVYLNDQWRIDLSYETQKRGAWRHSVRVEVFQEGYEDWATGIEADVTWYPYDNLNLDLRVNPQWSRDWLIWLQEDQFASYSRRNIKGEIIANWFPAENHEVRLRAQWLTIDAYSGHSFRIGPRGRLVPSDDAVEDFAMINFGFQVRYRYEIAPLSDFYAVYSRGGLERIDDSSRSAFGLLGDATSLRDSDQFLIKLRYRF